MNQTLNSLKLRPGGVYLDGTLGGGGHTEAILQATEPDGKVIGLDQDDEALAAASQRLKPFGERFCPIRANFAEMEQVLAAEGIAGLDGVLLDIGVSSHQLDEPDRGFSYMQDGKFWKSSGVNGIPNTGLVTGRTSDGMMSMMMGSSSSNKITAAMMGGSTLPVYIGIYPVDFKSKDKITEYLDGWNDMCKAGETYEGVKLDDADIVKYTDTVGLIVSMINTMIQMITIALVAFTALSLVVSTVMVGIITYVSVVERIKEIGILRSVGARKKDIKRLFIAETFIIGLAAGIVGVAVTYIISLIINLIVGSLVGIFTIASLPVWQALIMVVISVVLTLISGLISASAAAKKDPVVALRTE